MQGGLPPSLPTHPTPPPSPPLSLSLSLLLSESLCNKTPLKTSYIHSPLAIRYTLQHMIVSTHTQTLSMPAISLPRPHNACVQGDGLLSHTMLTCSKTHTQYPSVEWYPLRDTYTQHYTQTDSHENICFDRVR